MNNICPKCGGELVLSILVRYNNVPIWDGSPETEMGDESDTEITSVRCRGDCRESFPQEVLEAKICPNCKKPTEREWIEFANAECNCGGGASRYKDLNLSGHPLLPLFSELEGVESNDTEEEDRRLPER